MVWSAQKEGAWECLLPIQLMHGGTPCTCCQCDDLHKARKSSSAAGGFTVEPASYSDFAAHTLRSFLFSLSYPSGSSLPPAWILGCRCRVGALCTTPSSGEEPAPVGRGLPSQRYNIMPRIALNPPCFSSLILVALLFSPVRFS
jgi:hypothetical protein